MKAFSKRVASSHILTGSPRSLRCTNPTHGRGRSEEPDPEATAVRQAQTKAVQKQVVHCFQEREF